MQYLPLLVSLLAASVAAKDCKRGGSYCGSSLLRKGNYRNEIANTLHNEGLPTDERHVMNSRFDCLPKGQIAYRQFCSGGCGGINTRDADYCL